MNDEGKTDSELLRSLFFIFQNDIRVAVGNCDCCMGGGGRADCTRDIFCILVVFVVEIDIVECQAVGFNIAVAVV